MQCNREWPCNHCLKRKVADKCRFIPSKESYSPGQDAAKKRARSHDDTESTVLGDDAKDGDDSLGLEAMGYMAGSLLASLDSDVKVSCAFPRTATNQSWTSWLKLRPEEEAG